MTDDPIKVLVIHPNEKQREELINSFEDQLGGAEISGQDINFLEEIQNEANPCDILLVTSEIKMQEYFWIEKIKEQYPDTEIILLNQPQKEICRRASASGIFRCTNKICEQDEIISLVQVAAKRIQQRTLNHKLLSIQDHEQIIQAILASIPKVTMADDVALVLVDSDSGRMRRFPVVSQSGNFQRIFKQKKICNEMLKTNQMTVVSDCQQDERISTSFQKTGIRSLIGVPIPGKNDNIGILYVFSQAPGYFDRFGENNLLKQVAMHIGSALDSALTLKQTRLQADYMVKLIQVGSKLTQSKNIEEQCQIAWEFISSQLKVSTFLFGIYDESSSMLTFPLAMDNGQQIIVKPRCLAADAKSWGLSGYIIKKTRREVSWSTAEDGDEIIQKMGANSILIGKPSQSCFYLPLEIGSRVIGIISIQSYEKNAFGRLLLDVIRAFGSLLVTSVENQRLFLAVETRGQEAESLRQAALALSLIMQPKQLWQRLLTELQKVVPYDSSSVQLLKGEQFELVDGLGFPNLDELLGVTFPVNGNNPNHEVFVQRKSIIFEDITEKYEHISQLPHKPANIHSWLGVPMFDRNQLIGMLALDKHSRGFYTQEHAHLAEAFAAQAALAIQNVQLLESTQQANDYIQSAYQSSLDIISPMETPDVLNAIVIKIKNLSNAWRVSAVLKERNELPSVLAQAGFGVGSKDILSIRHDGISDNVIRSRSPRFFSNLSTVPNVNPDMLKQGVRAAACLPLQVGDVSFGVIWIHFRELHDFQDIEIKVLTTFANQSSVAYQHSKLYDEQKKVQNETRLVARSVAEKSPDEAMHAIVLAAKNVLHCDIVTLYAYNPIIDEFVFPPALIGVKDTDSVRALGKVTKNSLVRAIIQRNDLYICENTHNDDFVNHTYERKAKTPTFIEREDVGSFCGVPLKVGAKKVGVLFINFYSPRAKEKFDLENIQLFSNQAAIAIQNSQLYQESLEKERVLKAVLAANKVIAETLSLGELLKRIVEQARLLTHYNGATAQVSSLYLVKNNHLLFMAGDPVEKISQANQQLVDIDLDDKNLKQSIAGQVVENHRPQLVPEASTLQQGFQMLGPRAHSILAVPIIFNSEITGVITVEHEQSKAFDEQDAAVLEMLATQAGYSIRNAHLYERVNENRLYLKAIYEASSVMVSSYELEVMLEKIVETLKTTLNAWRVVAWVTEEGEEKPGIIMQSGFDNPKDAEIPYRPEGVSRRVMRTEKPIFQENITPGNVLIHPTTVEQGVKAAACLPLLFRNATRHIQGVLWIDFHEAHIFSYTEKDALEIFATQAALAIERSLDFKDLKRTKGMVGARTAVAWMGMVSSTWTHTIVKQADTIGDLVALLRLQLAKPVPDQSKVQEYLAAIQRLGRQIKEKPINAPLPDEEEGDAILINSLVGERLRQLWRNEPYNHIELKPTLQLDENVLVRANREWLRRALDILIDNAVGALTEIESPQICVDTRVFRENVEISIEDNGNGIPEWLREYLLIKPVPKKEGEKGLGLGLLMAQTIIQSYGGEIRPDYGVQKGSRFVIELPIERVDS